jgi:cbb3-type cytochrome oxidase subunit 3
MAEETVNVNPDGSTTFEGSAAGGDESTMPPVDEGPDEETMEEVVMKGTDPAFYLLMAVVLIGFLYFLYKRKARADQEDEFFANLEDEKVREGNRNSLTLVCTSSAYTLVQFSYPFTYVYCFIDPCTLLIVWVDPRSSTFNYLLKSTNITPSKKSACLLDGNLAR